tara:strand:+ start:1497 stop:2045 length:549 start_codon:yes stop_codon:yes gene_type:complete
MAKPNWKDYYKDLTIPSDWVDVSYSNDVLPSFQTSEDDAISMHVFIDSYDETVRADNTEDVTGQRKDLMARFAVSPKYGDEAVFLSNDFDEVLKFISKQVVDFRKFQSSRKKHMGHYIYLPTKSDEENFDPSRDYTNYLHIEIVSDGYEAPIDRDIVFNEKLEVVEKALFDLANDWGIPLND